MSKAQHDEFFKSHMDLVEAAGRIYFAGVWRLDGTDLTAEQQAKLFEDLRNALGLKPGSAAEKGVAP